ncbi:MAG: PKD domain-containing protein, partial [Bacteroidota bacterium]
QPVAEIFADRTIGCLQDMQVNFASAQPDSATSWLWEFGDGNLDFGAQVNHQYLQPDTVFAVLRLNHSGFCFDQDSIRLEIGHDVVSAFDLLPMGECSDAVEVFTVNNSQFADRYLWGFGDGRGSEAFNPIVPFDWPGDYLFELIAYNDYFQCADTSEQLLEYPRSSAGFDFDAVSGCSPFTVQFQDTSRGVTEWIWDFGDGSPLFVTTQSDSVAHTYREGGEYEVTLYVNYQGVCQDTFVSNKLVRVIQSPVAGFEMIRQPEPPGSVQFLDTSLVPGDFYEWDFGDDSPASSEQNPFHQYEILDTVTVIQYVSNVGGCRDSAQETILSGAYGLFVPSAFVPGGGPAAERWTFFLPVGVGLAEYEMAVYNKYGNKIFGTTSLDEDGRPDEKWDGTIRGAPAQAGTYIWRIHKARFKNGAELRGPREGSVTLIR